MKVLYTNFHTSRGTGGHTSYVLSLARALARRHEVLVAAPPGSALHRRAGEVPGVRVYAQSFPNRFYRLFQAALRLRGVIARERVELVHVNGSADHRLAILATLGMGAQRPRIVFTKHNDRPISRFGGWLRASFGTDHAIGVCDFACRMLADSPYQRCPLSTIGNGVDTRYFAPDAPGGEAGALRARLLRRPGRRFLLGSNAGTDDYKGWLDMVEAVSRLPPALRDQVQIALAGAPLSDSQRARIDALGMREHVTWAGRLEDVRTFIGALDMGFVLSYRVETISFACREMMAMGKPVVVSSHGGLPENITPYVDGWVVPERDAGHLARLLEHLLARPALLPEAGAAARRKCEQSFRLDRFVQLTEQAYARALGREALATPAQGGLGDASAAR
ncbi:glycosyltransferase [Achromobacter aloeverae]